MDSRGMMSAERFTLNEAAEELSKYLRRTITRRKLLELGARGQIAIAAWSTDSSQWCYVPRDELFKFERQESYSTPTLGFHSSAQDYYEDETSNVIGGGSEIVDISDLYVLACDLSRLTKLFSTGDINIYELEDLGELACSLFYDPNESIASQVQKEVWRQTERRQKEDAMKKILGVGACSPTYAESPPQPDCAQTPIGDVRQKRHSEGRYTPEEAAEQIALETDERAENILVVLTEAIRNNEIPRYPPDSNLRFTKSRTFRSFYDEVYLADVKEWLNLKHPRVQPIKKQTDTTTSPIIAAPEAGDALTPYIREACENLASKNIKPTAGKVMSHLQLIASAEHPVIKSHTAGGITIENYSGDQKEISKEAIRGRIRNWQESRGITGKKKR